ncbi:ABC transporter ATP-binding protein [Stieleria varia]|uniref:Daunorubicin/doxorubicin resistance ATP-binding protein DrrA n=1 Tax=Stieleria varia TaxID=2528005 RepID=A0A5C6BBY9_9BACT|nr:ABC transporter ATP-binding protein [Stieleria varia]TWU08044.1 Daunorubicin/doxorubicin resistance ATP-binding protein DrrA [Stieleria varia]
MQPTIVDVQQLRKTYRGWSWGRRRDIDAVRGVSLQAYAGEVFGLLGPNGAGKTTLIKMLLGVVKPSGGWARLFDQPIGSSAARIRVGYLPESLRVDRHHTARSALTYYGRMSRMSEADIRRRSDELLDLVGLSGRDRESVRRFSKGMYQRLGLAQALMHDPDLLVMDEPTDGLDPVGRNEVRMVLERLRDAGKTIFLNSHILQEVELVCSRVAVMARGEIRAIGTLDELASQHGGGRLVITVVDSAERGDPAERVETLTADAKQILPDESELLIDSAPDGATRMTVAIQQQDLIDAMVDRLRASHWSIRRLETTRPSLESTFMQLVGQQAVSDE